LATDRQALCCSESPYLSNVTDSATQNEPPSFARGKIASLDVLHRGREISERSNEVFVEQIFVQCYGIAIEERNGNVCGRCMTQDWDQ
jgi:hypothetical protein